jgi:hypothetical protein
LNLQLDGLEWVRGRDTQLFMLFKMRKCCGLGRPEPMINFSSEAITSVVLEAIGFTGEN